MTRRRILKGFVFTLLCHLLLKKLFLAAQGEHDAPFLPEVTGASLAQLLTPVLCSSLISHRSVGQTSSHHGPDPCCDRSSSADVASWSHKTCRHFTKTRTWAAQLCEDHASVQGPFMVMVQSLCIGFFDITGGLLAQGHCVVPPTHLNSRSVLQYGEHLSQRGFIFLTFVVWNNWHFLRNLFLHTECAGCAAREGGTLRAGELHQSRRLGK